MSYQKPDAKRVQLLKDIANKMRIHIINMTTAANSGHPTSGASAADIMSVLFFQYLHYSVDDPRHVSSDRFVLSKGHSCPVLYATLCEIGLLTEEHLLTLRSSNSILEGHPAPRRQSYIDVATGSLGQGLGIAAGMAYCGKYYDKASYRVFTVMGDGEIAEGSVWEAASFAGLYKLDNLVAIIDVNRFGQSQTTAFGHNVEVYQARMQAFGFNAIIVDGHDIEALCRAFYDAEKCKGKPTCLIAKTFKGRGFLNVENLENWHGKPLGAMAKPAIDALKKIIVNNGPHGLKPLPIVDDAPHFTIPQVKLNSRPNYKLGEKIATRKVYGDALVKLGKNYNRIVALDGDMKNSTFSLTYKKAFPERYIECFIAEQNICVVGVGLACRERNIVFCSAYASFLTRAFDQVRMGAISGTQVNFVGSHHGCSVGEDGAAQMALEDFAMFRTLPGAVCFYPSDAVSCERAIELAANYKGITYTSTSRPSTPVIYSNDEIFEIGKGKVVRESANDEVTVVGAGVTLEEAIKAHDTLKDEGIGIKVVDPFTIKPIDKNLLIKCARTTGGRILTVEDHHPEGGIGEAVCAALSEELNIQVRRLAVEGVPGSGPGREIMDQCGITARYIVKTVKELLP